MVKITINGVEVKRASAQSGRNYIRYSVELQSTWRNLTRDITSTLAVTFTEFRPNIA